MCLGSLSSDMGYENEYHPLNNNNNNNNNNTKEWTSSKNCRS